MSLSLSVVVLWEITDFLFVLFFLLDNGAAPTVPIRDEPHIPTQHLHLKIWPVDDVYRFDKDVEFPNHVYATFIHFSSCLSFCQLTHLSSIQRYL